MKAMKKENIIIITMLVVMVIAIIGVSYMRLLIIVD